MANPYPALITDANSETRVAGQINFTDPANQPGGSQPAHYALVKIVANPAIASFSGAIPWDTAIQDTDGFFDAANNRLRVPVGLGGVYIVGTTIEAQGPGTDAGLTSLNAFISMANVTPDDQNAWSTLDFTDPANQSTFTSMSIVTPAVDGDYFTAHATAFGSATWHVAGNSSMWLVLMGT